MQYHRPGLLFAALLALASALLTAGDTSAAGRILLIVDDLGHEISAQREAACFELPLEVAFSVIPGTPRAAGVGHRCLVEGRDVLAHFPWEPFDGGLPVEVSRLDVDGSTRRMSEIVELARAELPMMVGANNHQGSRASCDAVFLERFASVWARTGLPFLDSGTSSGSLIPELLGRQGIAVLENGIFLDHVDDDREILGMIRRLETMARSRELVIALAHPRSRTLRLLADWLSELPDGIRLVNAREAFREAQDGIWFAEFRTPPWVESGPPGDRTESGAAE